MDKNSFDHTQFSLDSREIIRKARREEAKEGLTKVYEALCEKGYNPIAQLIGYLLTEDPTYITSHNDARKIMSRMDRDDVLDMLLRDFLEK